MERNTLELANEIVKHIDDKLGQDTTMLDLKNVSTLCDYFIITSTSSMRQTKAIADEIQDRLGVKGINILHKEGYDTGKWILLDYGDIVVHIFQKEERIFYDIEGIWKDATIINIDKIIENNI